MRLENFLKSAEKVDCILNLQTTGSLEWKRVFIEIPSETPNINISLGRASFLNDELYYMKSYKRGYINTLCRTDRIMLKLFKIVHDGIILTDVEYDQLVDESIKFRDTDLAEKLEWRKQNNPKKKRSRLEGRNVRNVLKNMVYEFKRN